MRGGLTLEVAIKDGRATTKLTANVYEIATAADLGALVVMLERLQYTMARFEQQDIEGAGSQPEDNRDG